MYEEIYYSSHYPFQGVELYTILYYDNIFIIKKIKRDIRKYLFYSCSSFSLARFPFKIEMAIENVERVEIPAVEEINPLI
jgi:hypothetical protein